METWSALLEYKFLGNTLLHWGLAALAFVFTFLVLPLARGWIRSHGRRRERKAHTPSAIIDLALLVVGRTSRLVLFIVALYLAEQILTLPPGIDRFFDGVIIVGLWLQVGLWASVVLRFFLQRQHHKQDSATQGAAARASVSIIMFVAQLVIWALLALLALDNLGVNITTLVAGLGIGGIAVALAVQTVLGDLLGSLSIAFDKPFGIGDNLKIDDYEGTVEYIGLKSTRLRSVTGEQIVLSNADVLKSRVRNMGRMSERRLYFKLYVPYDTDASRLDTLAEVVSGAITSQQHTRFVQCLLTNLGAYAMEFEVIWFVSAAAGIEGNRIVDAVNRRIVKDLAAAGIRLTYPTQRVLHKNEDARAAEDGAAAPGLVRPQP